MDFRDVCHIFMPTKEKFTLLLPDYSSMEGWLVIGLNV